MSERNKKKFISSETGYKAPSGNLFSQLRHVAGEVENGIQNLRQELDSKRTESCGDNKHTSAINFLLHTKKDMSTLREEAKAKMVEFAKGNAKINRIHELMKSVLDLQSERLENVESYIEKYGYQRPIVACRTNVKNCDAESGGDSDGFKIKTEVNNCVSDESENEDNDSSLSCSQNDCTEGGSPTTPPSHTAPEKPADSNVQTPRLEDLYKNLSEETILFIKHGAKVKSEDWCSAKQSATIEENTFNLSKSTDQPAASLHDRNLINKGTLEPFSHPSGNIKNGKFEYSSMNSHKFQVSNTDIQGSPEMPKLLTPGFELSASKNFFTVERAEVSAWNDRNKHVPRTPEPPTLLLNELLTLNNDTGKCETSICSGVVAAPDTPKLLTPGFKLNVFKRGAESTIIGNIETANPSVPTVGGVSKMKTPEPPRLLMPGFKQSSFDVNPPENKVGKSARALFNTPPMPELKSCFLIRNDVSDNQENMLISKSTCFSTPETPQLLSQNTDFSRGYKYTSNSYKK